MKKISKRMLSVVLMVAMITACIVTPKAFNVSAEEGSETQPVATTRKTYTFDSEDEGVKLPDSANDVIENGAAKIKTTWGREIQFDFPLHANKKYQVILSYKMVSEVENGAKETTGKFQNYGVKGSEKTQLSSTSNWPKWNAGEYTSYVSSFETGTDVKDGVSYMMRLDMDPKEGLYIVLDHVTIYEIGAAAYIDFNSNGDFITQATDTSYTKDGSWVLSQAWGGTQTLAYTLEKGKTYNYEIAWHSEGGQVSALMNWHCSDSKGNTNQSIVEICKWKKVNSASTKDIGLFTIDSDKEGYLKLVHNSEIQTGASAGTQYIDYIRIWETAGGNVTLNTNAEDVILSAKTLTGGVGETVSLPTPVRAGYQFLGWYKEAEFINQVTQVVIPEKGKTVTLYAKWETSEVTMFDFSDASHVGNANAAEIINGTLKMSVTKAWNSARARLPYKLENGTTYQVSFQYKATKEATYNFSIWAGQELADYGNWTMFGGSAEDKNTYKIADAVSGKVEASDTWKTATVTFTPNCIDASYQYLGFLIKPNAAGDIRIDHVMITKTGATYDFSNAAQNTGGNDCKIEDGVLKMSNKGGSQSRIKFGYELKNGTRYRLTFKYKGEGSASIKYDFQIQAGSNKVNGWTIFDNDKNQTYKICGMTLLDSETEWKEVTIDFVPNCVTEEYCQLGFRMQPTKIAGDTAKHTLFIDDVQIETLMSGEIVFETGTPDVVIEKMTGKVGEEVVLPKPIRSGYEFLGWYTEAEFTNCVTTARVPDTGNVVTLYAKWQETIYTVFDFSDASHVGNANAAEIVDETLKLSVAKPWDSARARLPFKLENGVTYQVSFQYKAVKKATYNFGIWAGRELADYGNWTMFGGDAEDKGTYKIADALNGELEASDTWKVASVIFTPECIDENYQYLGFRIKPDKVGEIYIDDVTISKVSAVAFDTLTTDLTVDAINGAEGEKVVLPQPVRKGYVFAGWYYEKTLENLCTELVYPKGGTTVTLYAKWENDSNYSAIGKLGTTTFDFSNPDDYILCSGEIHDGVADLSNPNAVTKPAYQNAYLMFTEYELENGYDYKIEVTYKTTIAKFNCQVLNFQKEAISLIAPNTYWMMENNAAVLGSFGNAPSTEWTTKTIEISTYKEINSINKYLGIRMQVQGTADSFIIDQVKVTKTKSVVKSPVEKKVITFDDASDIVTLPGNCHVENGTLVYKAGWGQRLGLDFLLMENAHVSVKVKYKVTGEQSANAFAYTGTKKAMNKEDTTFLYRLWKWNKLRNTEYQTLAFEFDTTSAMLEKGNYFWLYLDCDPAGNTSMIIDEISIEQYTGSVNLKAKYNGLDIDIEPARGQLGQVITLPKSIIHPFTVSGWYLDEALTKKVDNDFLLSANGVTLYGKVKANTKSVLDFEDDSDVLWSGNCGIADDPANKKNHVLSMKVGKAFDAAYANLSYMWQPNHVYEVTMKYKTDSSVKAQVLLRNGNGTKAWNSAGNEFENTFSYAMYNKEVTNKSMESLTVKVITDDPVVNNVNKYFVWHFRGVTLGTLYVDDIVIEDKGIFDATSFDAGIHEYTWETVSEDMALFGDWKNWLTKGKDGKSNKADGVAEKAGSLWGVIAGVTTAVLAVGGGTLVVVSKKRKGKIKKAE